MVVARNCEGFVLGGKLSYREDVANSAWVEMEAIREGILWAHDKSTTKAIFDSDNANMINQIKKLRILLLWSFISKRSRIWL